MSGFAAPNYTMVPNDFFELVPQMEFAELKVLICIMRATFGFHRPTVRLSIREIARATSLTPKSVMAGAAKLEKRGLIRRTVILGITTVWEGVIEDSTPLRDLILQGVILDTGKPTVKESKESEIKDQAPAARPPDILDGMLKYQKPSQTLISAIGQYWPFNVNWRTKTARQWLEWAHNENVTPEQLRHAAEVWKSDKRFNWGQPNLQKIFENWPALMGKDMNAVDPSVHVQWQFELEE